MSVHQSLRARSLLNRSRNVFTRQERLEQLEKDGKRKTEDSVFGLPKVRTRFKVAKKKGDAAAKGEGEAAAPGAAKPAAPAAGAKPGAPAAKAGAPAAKEAAKPAADAKKPAKK